MWIEEVRSHRYICLALALALAVAVASPAAAITVEVEQTECMPVGDNGLVHVNVTDAPSDSEVRVYFRRLHQEVEDFYYVVARPEGNGRYWAVVPKAEDQILEEYRLIEELHDEADDDEVAWAEWWKFKEASEDRDPNEDLDEELIEERAQRGKLEKRDWMNQMSDQDLEEWLQAQENEPAEYFAEVVDPEGNVLASSEMLVSEVRHECEVVLTQQQLGEAANLTVGETAAWESGKRVFHWLCDGIATRIDPTRTLVADELCRICFIAWWKKEELLIPALVPPVVVTLVEDDPTPVSPSGP